MGTGSSVAPRQLSSDFKELLSVLIALALVTATAVAFVVAEWELPFVATYGVLVLIAGFGYVVSRRLLFARSASPAKSELESDDLRVPRNPAA